MVRGSSPDVPPALTVKEHSLHPDAILEATEAWLWYLDRSADAAADFVEEFDRAMASIIEAPERWPALESGRRRFVLRRFPFVIWYRIREEDIRVLAFAHARRRPGYWKGRV